VDPQEGSIDDLFSDFNEQEAFEEATSTIERSKKKRKMKKAALGRILRLLLHKKKKVKVKMLTKTSRGTPSF